MGSSHFYIIILKDMAKIRSKKSAETKQPSQEEVALLGINYVKGKEEIKKINNALGKVRVPLENYMDANQQELPNGSYLCQIPHADVVVNLKRTLRNGKELVPEAEDILRANGLEDCIENVPTIREDRIEALYQAGKISDEILQKIYVAKPSYAFSVSLDKKNKIPEV